MIHHRSSVVPLRDVAVDGLLYEAAVVPAPARSSTSSRSIASDAAAAIRAHVLHQAVDEARVVRLADDVVFLVVAGDGSRRTARNVAGTVVIELLFEPLTPVELGVRSVVRQQIVVCAALDDAAVFEHDDLVGPLHRGHAMRDDHRRAPCDKLLHPGENPLLGVGVHVRERVVENQDRRLARQRSRDRYALLLAARERYAALADHGLQAVRELWQVLGELR